MKKIILAILDGVGYSEIKEDNAVYLAQTPFMDSILDKYPHSLLAASGVEVGLPLGQMGNSEVGHLTIGSGRILFQPLQRINKALEDKDLMNNEELNKVIMHVQNNDSKLHICGLLSDGGIHSHINHILALIDMAFEKKVNKIYLHLSLDGRDTLPNIAQQYINALNSHISIYANVKIATISGRYYSMDRERSWDRTKKAYDAMVIGETSNAKISDIINDSYDKKIYDEFILPSVIDNKGIIENNDGIILANFRPDRATQLFSAITNPNFNEFETKKLTNLKMVSMMPVSNEIICSNAFEHLEINNTLYEVLTNNNYRLLQIAELSKYPHITHFMQGDKDVELINAKKIEIPKKDVATYDLDPEMSAIEVTNKIIEDINNYDFIAVNYANGDMVGHTGNLEAAKKAMETIDKCLEELYKISKSNEFILIICADHGNCECMSGKNKRTHTTNPVRFIVCDESYHLKDGKLSDIAPSILNMLGITIPKEMNGNIIVSKK